LALEELRDDVGRAVPRVGSDVVDGGDVGMVQQPRRPRLLLEAAQAIRVLGEGRRKDLDRDLAPETRGLRAVGLSPASRAERRQDLVRAEARARRKRHLSGDSNVRSRSARNRRSPRWPPSAPRGSPRPGGEAPPAVARTADLRAGSRATDRRRTWACTG